MLERLLNLSNRAVLLILGALVVVPVMVSLLVHLTRPAPNFTEWLEGFLLNFSTEMLGAIVTFALLYLIVEHREKRLEEQKEESKLKARLIREMGSPDNATALNAVRELRAHGWLENGTLQGANLIEANLQGANLEGVNLQRANLTAANLLEANLNRANLQKAQMRDANLQKAKLEEADLRKAFLAGVDMREAYLAHTNLEGAYLFKAKLTGIYLFDVNLQGAILGLSSMQQAYLVKVNLRGADLAHVNLHEAELGHADLQETRMEGVNLSGAHLHSAKVTDNQLAIASSLRGATMPDGRRYDGRFNLWGDIRTARRGHIDTDNPEAIMAEWYGISLDEYQHGQEWARENLPRLRREEGEG